MIPQIKELNFPEYATLSTATVTLNDMGDKTISAQVKIDGRVAPDFSYDWEVEFQGERYIHPLREPQASKGNESICSAIDLTFYHKTIYDLKRYYFVEMATTESGTAMADKYIASLGVNLKRFCEDFQLVLNHYFNGELVIDLNPEWLYDEEPSYVEISYSHIWDVLLQMYDIFGVRWQIKGNTIFVGYPTEEVAHTFEYGFEGGLLKVERQVQSADIRNSLLGRGGSRNLPYLYFKDVDPNTPNFKADPDWIPELANIYFSELRGKTFRDYVKGWKAKHYGGTPMSEPTEAYIKGFTDTTFSPIEYVEDKDSIAKYGLLQGGLENQEDIYPSIQGIEVDGLGRIDEIVGVEEVLVDEDEEGFAPEAVLVYQDVNTTSNEITSYISKGKQTIKLQSPTFSIENGEVAHFIKLPVVEALCRCYYTKTNYYSHGSYDSRGWHSAKKISCDLVEYHLYDATTNEEIQDVANVPNDTTLYAIYTVAYYGYPQGYDDVEYDGVSGTWSGSALEYDDKCYVTININQNIDCNDIIGVVLGNYTEGNIRKSEKVSISKNSTKTVTIQSDTFEVPEDGATNVDVPVNIVVDKSGEGLYEFEKTVKAINVDTNEVVSSINIPKGKYYLRVSVAVRNNSTTTQTYKVELMPSYIYFPVDSEEFKPTFDIWVKNIWGTTRNEGESVEAYTDRVWTPILGDREGNEAKVVFTTGWLSGHSDYEFTIKEVNYAGGSGVEYDGVSAEWRLTLIKSDAEIEATGKWIPSTKQQAVVGDKFFFIGIDMPHQYILWAEEKLDNYKRDQLAETAHIKPTWVVQTDKVRLNESRDGIKLLDSFKIGNTIHLADSRFISSEGKTIDLYLQSITYSWDAQTTMLPNVEVVLSDKVLVSANPVSILQGEVDALTRQVGSISNLSQVVRVVGDKLFLRKDGTQDVSNSPTTFKELVSSQGYRQGAVGGNGWGLRSEQGKGIFEVDKLIVRDEMQVNTLVANQVSAIGGKEILSASSITCSRVETTEQGFKCYFDQKRGSIANLFVQGDIAFSQVFNPHDIEVKYYKREVIEVGDNYILLSLEGDGKGNGAPQEGDVIVQYGNTDTEKYPDRQYVIIRDVIGGGYERMLSDLNSVTASGIEYYFAGRLEGGTPRWFVGNTEQYVKFEDGKIQIECKQVGMTSEGEGDDTIRIWAGADNTDKGNAPFRVQEDGKVVATNADIKGVVNAESGSFKNGVFENVTIKGSVSNPVVSYTGASLQVKANDGYSYTFSRQRGRDLDGLYAWFNPNADIDTIYTQSVKPNVDDAVFDDSGNAIVGYKIDLYTNIVDGENGLNRHDNVAIPLVSERVLYADELSWDVSNSGRLIRLINASYGDLAAEGRVLMYAPSGQYFYEDGERYSQLLFSREVIELFGYGTETQFYGWLVLNRRNVESTKSYGAPQPILYQGTIDKNVLTRFWSAKYLHAADLKGAVLNPSTGVVQILVNEVGKNAIDDYRGLNDVNNWTVMASGATVTSKAYVQSTFNGVTYNCIEFNLDYTNTTYVTFQVISTADWAKLT